jgi:hypothetical protein
LPILLPKYLQAEIDYASQQQKINEVRETIETLCARTIREELEVIVHRKYPRMPVRHIQGAPDNVLWDLADPEVPQPPRYLYMNREDFYDVENNQAVRNLLAAHELEPIWNDDIAPGRVTVLTERTYKHANDIGRLHHRTEAEELGIVNWI